MREKDQTDDIYKMNKGNVLGKDEISAEIVKYIKEESQQELLDIMIQAKIKKVPPDWQISVITPLSRNNAGQHSGKIIPKNTGKQT